MNSSAPVSVEATGETVGEAKWAALRELEQKVPGLDRESVQFQVVSEGERGLLGVGFSPARVLASVDETTYTDPSAVRMGDHPVIWSNERMAARNVYIFMGHGPWLLEDDAFTTIFRNAILWAAEKPPHTK